MVNFVYNPSRSGITQYPRRFITPTAEANIVPMPPGAFFVATA